MAPMRERDLEMTAWSWAPPLAFASVLLILWATGTNEAWFHRLNSWSTATGQQPWCWITICGDTLVLLALALPILWYRPQWVWVLLVAALLTTVATHTLKPWLDLPRPAAVFGADAITIIGPELRARAMPSGHAAAALTLAGALVPAMKSRSARGAVGKQLKCHGRRTSVRIDGCHHNSGSLTPKNIDNLVGTSDHRGVVQYVDIKFAESAISPLPSSEPCEAFICFHVLALSYISLSTLKKP